MWNIISVDALTHRRQIETKQQRSKNRTLQHYFTETLSILILPSFPRRIPRSTASKDELKRTESWCLFWLSVDTGGVSTLAKPVSVLSRAWQKLVFEIVWKMCFKNQIFFIRIQELTIIGQHVRFRLLSFKREFNSIF